MNGTLVPLPAIPFLFMPDDTIRELKGFFLTLYTAWRLNQQVFRTPKARIRSDD